MQTSALGLIACALALLVAAACAGGEGAHDAATAGPTRTSGQLLLASTTTTQDSGLLDALIPAFERRTGYSVKLVAGGSGQALENGRRGDLDVLLVHSPQAEEAFVAAGDGIERRPVMHNDFIVVGPAHDPADVRHAPDAAAAFRAIAAVRATFVSRGDQSGTNVVELGLWRQAGVDPEGQRWYVETGQGQGATLQVASQRGGYALADRGTWLAQRDVLTGLAPLFEGQPPLLNHYHVIVVNPQKHPKVNVEAARAFAAFVTGAEGQAIIATFGVDRYGEPLFVPDAGDEE